MLNKGNTIEAPIKADIGISQVKRIGAPTTQFRSQKGTGATIKVPVKGSNTDIIR